MLWPVLLDPHPREAVWSVGERVTTRLRWLDDPELPAELVLRHVAVRASTLRDADRRPWAQLVEAGDLLAVRQGEHRSGALTLDGCLGVDAFLGLIGELPATVGVVRRVRVVHDRYDRGVNEWSRRPGHVRLTDVPDAAPERLRDGSTLAEPPPQAAVQFVSPAQYIRITREGQRWQARGFLVDLDVP